MIVISLFAFTSDFRGCDVHRTTGARDEGSHRLAHDTEPRRGDCILICIDRQPMRTFPRDPSSAVFALWASHARSVGGEGDHTHHLHGARRLASHRVYDENFDSSLHLLQLIVPPRVYIPPPPTYFSSAVVVEHPVDWRVGDEVVDDPVQRVGVVDLVVTLRMKLLDVRHVGPHHDALHHDQLEQDPG